ncbi:MAG: hypothetical protein ACK440_02375 [Sphingomonadaceae bacterium]|jgi:hypothetical protein
MAVEIPLLKLPDHVLAACQQGGRHLTPVMRAVRYYGVSMVFVPQGIKDKHEALPAVLAKPFIALIGDDMHQALGPKAFGKKMLTRLIRDADTAAIIACEAIYDIYDQMSQKAAIGRRNVLIIETLAKREMEWLSFLRSVAPNLPITLCTVKPEVQC